MENRQRLKFALAFAAVYVIWGSTYLAIRFAVETLPPFLMAGVRFITAGGLLYLVFRPRISEKLTFQHWKSAFIIGGLLLLGGIGLVSWAEKYVPSGLAAMLVATIPLWIFFMEWLFLDAKLTLKSGFGILLGLAGLVLLLNPLGAAESGDTDLTASLAIVLAALLWAIGSIYSKRAPHPKSSFLNGAMQMLCGGVLLILAGLLLGETSDFSMRAVSGKSLFALCYLSVFGSIVALSAYFWLLKNTSATKATTYAFVNPAVAVFLGWLLAEEQISQSTFAALALIIVSVVLVLSSKQKTAAPDADKKSTHADTTTLSPSPNVIRD